VQALREVARPDERALGGLGVLELRSLVGAMRSSRSERVQF
jgi:hypothetical protein